MGIFLRAEWDRLRYYSQKVKVFNDIGSLAIDHEVHPSTYFRIAQLQSSALFPSLRHLHYFIDDRSLFLFLSPLLESLELRSVSNFEYTVRPFLVTLSSQAQILSWIELQHGEMSVDNLKTSIVHFKQLRSLTLFHAVIMSDFVLWEVLGTLPSLADLTLAIDPRCHPAAHDSENSNGQSGVTKYLYDLENLCVTSSFYLIQHLLSSIDSPCLKSIKVHPYCSRKKPETEDLFTSSMKIVTLRIAIQSRNP